MRRWVPPMLVIMLALGLRALRLGAAEPWFNEAYTGILTYLDPAKLLQAVHREVSPPLGYILLRSWAGLFGHEPIALRAFSVLCGTITAGLLYAIARRASTAAATAAGFVAAISPAYLEHSREARVYGLLVLWVAGSIACLLRAVEAQGRGRRCWWGGCAVLSAAAIATHYHAFFVVVALPLAALVHGRRAGAEAAIATAAAGILVLPLVPWVMDQARFPATLHVAKIYYAIPPSLAIPRTLELFTPGALFPTHANFRFGAPLFGPGVWVPLAAALVPGVLAARSGESASSLLARVGIVLLFAPLGLMLAVSLFRPLYMPGRYDLVAFPGFAILAGVGIAQLAKPVRVLLALAAIALASATYPPIYAPSPAYASTTEGVRARLVPALRPGDVLLFTGYGMPAVRYALLRGGSDFPYVTMPRSTAAHAGWVDLRYAGDGTLRGGEARLAAREALARARGGRVWLLADGGLRWGAAETELALEELGFRPVARERLSEAVPGQWCQPIQASLFVLAPLPSLGAH